MSSCPCPCFDSETKKPVIKYTYSKENYGSTITRNNSSVKKSSKRKKNNKSKEVESWDDIDEKGNYLIVQAKVRMYIPPKYTEQEMRKMKWGDLNELTDEEAWGYFVYE